METIKNYLETMFASLPNTAEVQKARKKLLQMMEDKYTGLLKEGKADHEAVGIVISEFGNLDKLADDLGIKDVLETNPVHDTRKIGMEEASAFINDRLRYGLLIAIGVYLCITSVCVSIFCEAVYIDSDGNAGPLYMFLSIAVAVGLFVYAGVSLSKWSYLKKERCSIDYATTDYVAGLKNSFRSQKALLTTIGVVLCVLSVVPAMIMDEWFSDASELGTVFMLIMVGIGVMLFISSAYKFGSYDIILNLSEHDKP